MPSSDSTQPPPSPRRWRHRTIWLLVLIGIWCALTGWLSILPREEVRVWETAIIHNDYFRRTFSRELLIWRPVGFSLMGHVAFYFPFGVAAFWVGRAWGRQAMMRVAVLACVWAALTEASQFLVEDRTPRVADLAASWVGIALGLAVCMGFSKLAALVRNRRTPKGET